MGSAIRATNTCGRALEELRRILHDLETIEPRLRRVADHKVQTTTPLDDVVTAILRLARA